jgi:hypothetical protein
LGDEVDATVGQAEEDVVIENLAFFRLPLVTMRGPVALPRRRTPICSLRCFTTTTSRLPSSPLTCCASRRSD